MKKLKYLPTLLMAFLCVGVLAFGIYAITPTENTISGQITINASNDEIAIVGYVDDVEVFRADSVRSGVSLSIPKDKLAFKTDTANTLEDLGSKTLRINIKNKSSNGLGVYFYNGVELPEDGYATEEHITTLSQVKSGTKLVASMYMDSYSYLAPNDDESATNTTYDQIDMHVEIFPETFADSANDLSADFSLALNIEDYVATPNLDANIAPAQSATAVGSPNLSGLIKFPEVATTATQKNAIFSNNTQIEYLCLTSAYTRVYRNTCYRASALKGVFMPDSITAFDVNVFYGCENLTSVSIPDKMTALSNYCFIECTKLKVVNFNDRLETVPKFSFYQCTELTKVNLPNSLITIGEAAFDYCEKLQIDKLPKNIETLEEYAFDRCYSIKTLELPEGLKTIEQCAFRYCTGLERIVIPKSVITFENDVFQNCHSLKSAVFECSITTLEQFVFQNCYNLETVELPSTLTAIGKFAFFRCENLNNVVLPNGVKSIGEQAFYNSGITCVELPSTITSIGTIAFADCENLSRVVFPDVDANSTVNIGETAFAYTKLSGEMYIPDNYTLTSTSNGQFVGTLITSFRVNDTNTKYMTIDGVLYERSTEDPSVPAYLCAYPGGRVNGTYTLPASVSSIRRYELAQATTLKYITVEADNPTYSSKNGILYNKQGNYMLTIPQQYTVNGQLVKNYSITDATHLGIGSDGAYGLLTGNCGIENLTIGNQVQQMNNAFNGAYNLKSINSENVGTFDLSDLNLNTIGFKNFQGCTMNKLIIGKRMSSTSELAINIGAGFVSACTNLKEIYFEATVAPMLEYATYTDRGTLASNFDNLPEDYVIHVPTGCKQVYIDGWKAQIDADTTLTSANKTTHKAEVDALASHIQEYVVGE